MTINENITMFDGRPVADFDSAKKIVDAQKTVYRLRVDWETAENYSKKSQPPAKPGFLKRLFGKNSAPPQDEADVGQQYHSAFQELFHTFLADPAASEITALVVGDWGQSAMGEDSSGMIADLANASTRLGNLKHVFLGDITVEESEISWIEQSDMSPLWSAYPDLETFRVRGGSGLSLGKMNLLKLKTLIIETGGLSKEVIDQVCDAELPELQHLELWLGDEDYGWTGAISQLQPILDGVLFPNLKYLGLRNSEEADAIAEAVAASKILRSLDVLDLSLGTLADKGVNALLAADGIADLKKLDIHHHYVSDQYISKLQGLGCELNADDVQTEDSDDDRYVAVSE